MTILTRAWVAYLEFRTAFRARLTRQMHARFMRKRAKRLAIRVDTPRSTWPKLLDDRDSISRSRGENGTPN